MKAITIVIDGDIAAGANKDVDIGVRIPMRRAIGTISAYDTSGTVGAQRLPPGNYTPTVVDDDTINIAVVSGATALANGDIVTVYVEEVGDICRV